MKYSILIRNGRIWDGERFLSGDVAIQDGKIAAIGQAEEAEAAFVYDAQGKLVTPGLVDIHTHLKGISIDAFGMQAEMACLPFGVTAAVDCGGSKGDKALLDSFLVRNAVFITVDIQNDQPDFTQVEELLPRYGSKAIGLKVYYDTHMYGVKTVAPLRRIVQYAQEHGLQVMVHCNRSPIPMADILDALRPGDILTHIYHGGVNTAMDDGFAALKAAKARGVIIDAGLAGHVHTDFTLLREAIRCGAKPNTISTDITCSSAYKRGGRYGLPLCMSLMRAMGLSEEEVLRAVTTDAAAAVHMPWGRLTVDGMADVAVLDEQGEAYALTDTNGVTFGEDHMYRCCLTVADGQVVYRS